MTDDRFQRIKAILARALDLSGRARGEYLDTACADDPNLRAEIDRILAADPARLKSLQTGGLDEWLGAGGLHGAIASVEDHPNSIGPYRILHPLGEGGMGAVYLA